MFVKPAQGLKIRDPRTRQFLPADGGEVADEPYWRRRLRDNDVTLAVPPQSAAETPAAPEHTG